MKLATLSQYAKHKDGTYVSMDLSDESRALLDNFVEMNLGLTERVDPSTYHITIIYSRTPVPSAENHAGSIGGDVAKAAAFYKGSLSEAEQKMQEMAASEAELAERKKASVDAQTKLTKAIESMQIAFTPILDVVSWIAERIVDMNKAITPFGTFLTVGIPLGIMAAKAAFSLFASFAKSAVSGMTAGVKSDLNEIIAKAIEARTAIANINIPPGGAPPPGGSPPPGTPPPPPGTPPPGTPPPGSTPGASGFGKVMSGLAVLGAVAAIASSVQVREPTGPVTNEKAFVNKPEEVPKVDAFDIMPRSKPVFELDEKGMPKLLAQANRRDTIEGRTPEERAEDASRMGNAISLNMKEQNFKVSNSIEKSTEIQTANFKEISKTQSQERQKISEYYMNSQPIQVKLEGVEAVIKEQSTQALQARAVKAANDSTRTKITSDIGYGTV